MRPAAFAAAFAHAPFAMALVEACEPFRLHAANASFAQLAGRTPDDPIHDTPVARVLRPEVAGGIVELLRRVAQDGVTRTSVEVQLGARRAWEITISALRSDAEPLLFVVGRDAAPLEDTRRRLKEASIQLQALTTFARASLSFEVEPLLHATVDAAATVARGCACIYLGAAGGPLRLAATNGVSPELLPALADVIPAGAFGLLRAPVDIASAPTQVLVYSARLPRDEGDLLRALGMFWAAAIPVRGQRETHGVLLAFARGPIAVVSPEQLQVLEASAAQLGRAFEQSRLYREVETERANLELVLENIPDAVVITDERGRVAHANATARKLFAVTPGAVMPTAERPDPPADPSSDERPIAVGTSFGDLGLRGALAGETVRGAISLIRNESAEPAWVMSSAAPVRTPDGTQAGAVAVATDITEHRRAEEALRTLADVSAALAGSLDYRGTLPTVARLLVQDVADLCTIDVTESDAPARLAVAGADTIAPELVRALERYVLQAATTAGDASTVVEHVTDAALRTLAADAEHLALLNDLGLQSWMRVPIAARGRAVGVLWLATSHSGRRYSRETRALAEEVGCRIAVAIDNARLFRDAQEANDRKDEFLAMLSHELRTPLAPIMAWIQILKRAADPERVQTAVEVIERNVRLQASLIDDLLDLTAITRGKVRLEWERHDLRTIVANAFDTVRAKTGEKIIVLAFEAPDEPLVVEGDGNRLQQVMWNLLTNAIKFSPAGERVVVTLVRDGDAALIRVRDRGAGIAPEFLPHVFDMFQQQEHGDRRRFGGLGIGLAIARRVTELHRGTITAHSEGAGQGAEFSVRLPLAATQTVTAGPAVAASLEGRVVLLVEDVPDTRDAAHVMLEHMGVRVIDASEGRDALAKLDQTQVDVVLCDLRMPIMDGFELIRRIRENPRHQALPVIAVSGYATQDDERRTREAGFDGYVRKPFVESTLVAAVERVMRERGRTARSAAST